MSEPARRGAVWTEERRWSDEGKPHLAAPRRRARGTVRTTVSGQPGRPAPLRLVADGGRLVPEASGLREDVRPARVRTAAARTPIRLTRRGRTVLTATAVLAIGAVSMVLAGAAQATGHSGVPAGPGSGVAKVLVRPGQSLWSLAESYDPDADTRLVIQDILQLNSMTSDQVQPGQVLWVPRG